VVTRQRSSVRRTRLSPIRKLVIHWVKLHGVKQLLHHVPRPTMLLSVRE
jgi:hypothetical protein